MSPEEIALALWGEGGGIPLDIIRQFVVSSIKKDYSEKIRIRPRQLPFVATHSATPNPRGDENPRIKTKSRVSVAPSRRAEPINLPARPIPGQFVEGDVISKKKYAAFYRKIGEKHWIRRHPDISGPKESILRNYQSWLVFGEVGYEGVQRAVRPLKEAK
jgi:hypothetical protein